MQNFFCEKQFVMKYKYVTRSGRTGQIPYDIKIK